MNQWKIRLATAEDALQICMLTRSALGYPSEPDGVAKQLAQILTRPSDRVFIACAQGETAAVGFVHAADYETLHSGSMKNIIALAVEPALQGNGLGRRLTETVEAWARESGCVAVRLVSSAVREDAHAFYLHCGYRLRKEQKNFIKNVAPTGT